MGYKRSKGKDRKSYIKVKRYFDFIVAVILFIIFSPLILVIAVAIHLESEGPIFFVQKRSGKNNKVFNLYKFRSMSVDNNVYDLKEEDKFTKVGLFIRKTSLDELPNMINIIKGEMSFIGPRPWIPEYALYFTEEQKHRLDVLPGITGYAQANGRNNLTIYQKINMDLSYVQNASIMLDLKIIFSTITSVFKKTGIDHGKYCIRDEIDELKMQYMYVGGRRRYNRRKEEEKELVGV